MESGRDPCPYRVLDDTGVAFSMGLLGGSVFHAIKGSRNSPPVRVHVLFSSCV